MKTGLATLLVCGALGVLGTPAFADPPRADAIWARSTNGVPIVLDGVLDEAAWATAESKVVRYGLVLNNGDPGSGSKEEGGILTKDSTVATLKFLVVGNKLYMGAVVSDSSVGGGNEFNRMDGLLMSLKDHTSLGRPAPPAEYLYSWWYQIGSVPDPGAAGRSPAFGGRWATPPWGSPRSPEQIAAWNAVTRVQGLSNRDTLPNGFSVADTGYVVEMVFDLGVMGYDVTRPSGDIIEWNISIYDTDWYWWKNLTRMSSNRAWWQSPWGNAMWYSQVRIHARPDITTSSGPVPPIGAEVRIPNGASQTTPTIDGFLTDAVWNNTSGITMRYGSEIYRNSYGNPLQWRAGYYQPEVNARRAAIFDTAHAKIKWFFKGNTLYLGFDVTDEVVQSHHIVDRWDGFAITINDRVVKYRDRNLEVRRIGFHVGPGGVGVADDYLPFLRDTAMAAQFDLKLKPGTTVDTLGNDFDAGYTAELALNLTALGYPSGLGDGALHIGINMFDGDSYTPFSLSYAQHTWWSREREYECCPAFAWLDPSLTLPVDVGDGPLSSSFALLGNRPNPFTKTTTIGFSMPEASDVTLEVFDLGGRRVGLRALGVLQPGQRSVAFSPRERLEAGVYLYRLTMRAPQTGTPRAELSGRMTFLH